MSNHRCSYTDTCSQDLGFDVTLQSQPNYYY